MRITGSEVVQQEALPMKEIEKTSNHIRCAPYGPALDQYDLWHARKNVNLKQVKKLDVSAA